MGEEPTVTDPRVLDHRVSHGNLAAIVFVHGFGGNPRTTWSRFPDCLAAETELRGWDIFSLGYPTTLLLPDISSLWSAEPELRTLSDEVATRALVAPFNRYQALAFVAHSMGGLIVQRALVDHDRLAGRVSHVLVFGTPSFGLVKAGVFRFWKRQTRDMRVNSEFIRVLRGAWTEQFSRRDHFHFLAVAGDQDEFVPRPSSLDGIPPPGFPVAQQMVVPGNHLQMVKPDGPDHLSVKVASAFLSGSERVSDSALVAAERAKFQAVVRQLRPSIGSLDDRALVALALALESLGQQDEAIAALEAQPNRGTDATGVLAGRLKRRWLLDRRAADAQQALGLYRQALDQARAANHQQQVYYHAINVAFLEWAYGDDRAGARATARVALDACAVAKVDRWRRSTEGEAAIILGDDEAALTSYSQALALAPSPREVDSMYQQASFELDLADDLPLARQVHALFLDRARGDVVGAG
jgi:pimeloyl-ACP methyl ester carboxylesterase